MRPAARCPPSRDRRTPRWIAAGCAALLATLPPAVVHADGPAAAPPPRLALELRRGDRVIPPGGVDLAPPTLATGPRERRFVYSVTNRSSQPVRLAPFAVRRAINSAVTGTAGPARSALAPGEVLNLTVVVTPRDRGPWRATVALPFHEARAPATAEFAWTLAAGGP